MGGSETEFPERYQACNPAALRDESVFTIIIHGANDQEVNVNQAITYSTVRAKNLQLEIWADADHFSMLPHDGAWSIEQWARLKDRIKNFVC
jgi:alpha/beta superfamily hydrolase